MVTPAGEGEPYVRVDVDGAVVLFVDAGATSEELVGALLRLVTNRTEQLRLRSATRDHGWFVFTFVGDHGAGRQRR